MTKTYKGQIVDGEAVVEVITDGRFCRPLHNRMDLVKHSPDGFQWGYGGSGPSQLAACMLADCIGDDSLALRYYQDFRWTHIASLTMGAPFELTEEQIRDWLDTERENRARRAAQD